MINLLSQETIDKIAAGEVVERPASCIKELCENSIDAGATRINVEIKGGGIDLIRVSDNGCGIEESELALAFTRHATSKIRDASDLISLGSLGFRGEALSSISAVSRVEVITKTEEAMMASRYRADAGSEAELTQVGAPTGTTFIVRDLFFNTPVRRKFLKSPSAEGARVQEIVEHLALSHPDIAFSFVNNGRSALTTYGQGSPRDVIYQIYGRDIARELIELGDGPVGGYIARPTVSSGSRNRETFFVNGRYVRTSKVITGALEEAFSSFMMQHRFPFAVLYLKLDDGWVDANIHPQKLEVRFSDNHRVYEMVREAVEKALKSNELIPRSSLGSSRGRKPENLTVEKPGRAAGMAPERGMEETAKPAGKELSQTYGEKLPDTGSSFDEIPFAIPDNTRETGGIADDPVTKDGNISGASEINTTGNVDGSILGIADGSSMGSVDRSVSGIPDGSISGIPYDSENETVISNHEPATYVASVRKRAALPFENSRLLREEADYGIKRGQEEKAEQLDLFEERLLSREAAAKYRIIGQAFDTYWIVQKDDALLLIDQHAAHEKVLYERFVKQIKESGVFSQQLMPPIIVTLGAAQEQMLNDNLECFEELGFEVESFGGRDYALRAVPENISSLKSEDIFMEVLDNLTENDGIRRSGELIKDRIATMACKAAVKGNNSMTEEELKTLLDEMMELDNPYNCPHGRPTMISLSKYELEKKFRRIV